MTRVRIAQVLAVLAALSVLGTGTVAATRWAGDDDVRPADATQPPSPLRVRDPRTGASFEVPAVGWRVEDRQVRIYYTDRAGHPVAVVRGPAVFRSGYCAARPDGSNRAFAGFTRQDFDTWVDALGRELVRTGSQVRLADGTEAALSWARVDPGPDGPCAAPEVYVAMVRAGAVRAVLVADTRARGTLPERQVEDVLTSLRL